ncbi:FIG137478: Hypothetical protein YbgI [hydrothermal vent metagenome]|uniref:Nif3-like dinuclear metal center hexameric protein n=1 Tax=hydrothermal vent metagenome TaxID=652676 RepID=A0A1W1CNB3_9ZZZZ
MITNIELKKYCHTLLEVDSFKDYCPNGLQIEGKQKIQHIVSGVSINLALIEKAIKNKADAIFVHHGFFWNNEQAELVGAKRKKIALLLENNINLFAYHLPLDAHKTLGNNIQLAKLLNIKNPKPIKNSLLWRGELDNNIDDFSKEITEKLQRKPQIFSANKNIKKIAWCSGGAQNYLFEAINLGADTYLSGEISEQTPYNALENNINYISAGHHATEMFGIQALATHLSNKFQITQQFININNPV